MPTATMSAPTTIHSSVSTPRWSLKYPISRFICFPLLFDSLARALRCRQKPIFRRAALRSLKPAVAALVRPDIGKAPALESHHDFRESLVRDAEHDCVIVDRSGRPLRRVEAQPELAQYVLNRWKSVVSLRTQHHHDRVSQSRISVQGVSM